MIRCLFEELKLRIRMGPCLCEDLKLRNRMGGILFGG